MFTLIAGDWVGVGNCDNNNVSFFSAQQESVINYLGVVGQYLIKTASATNGVQSPLSIAVGDVIELKYTVVTSVTGVLNAIDSGVIPAAVGTHTVIITAAFVTSNFYIKRNSGATEIVIKDLSVKRIMEVA